MCPAAFNKDQTISVYGAPHAGRDIAAQVRALRPKVVLPMHYKTDCMNFPISDEQPFLKALGAECERRNCLTVGEACAPVVLLALSRER